MKINWIISFEILNYMWNFGIGLGIIVILKLLKENKVKANENIQTKNNTRSN